MSKQIVIFSDGGARGNPGPAGIGAVIKMAEKTQEIAKYIGEATNNQAEYQAVIVALSWVKENIVGSHSESNEESAADAASAIQQRSCFTPFKLTATTQDDSLEIECFLDSQLIVEQLNQRYKLKNEGLKPLFWQVRDLVVSLGGKISFKYIPREQNSKADKLVNKALDEANK